MSKYKSTELEMKDRFNFASIGTRIHSWLHLVMKGRRESKVSSTCCTEEVGNTVVFCLFSSDIFIVKHEVEVVTA